MKSKSGFRSMNLEELIIKIEKKKKHYKKLKEIRKKRSNL